MRNYKKCTLHSEILSKNKYTLYKGTEGVYHKKPKIFILLSLSDLTFARGREGIDNPFIALVARFLFVCVGTRDLECSLLLE